MKWLVGRIRLLWERWYRRADIADAAWQSQRMDAVEERDKLRADVDGVVNVDVCHACGFEGPCSYDVYANGDVSVDVYAFCVDSEACVAMRKAPPAATTMDRDMVRASRSHAALRELYPEGASPEGPYDDDLPF